MNDAADTSVQLLRRYRDGDETALDALLDRQIQPMRQWARGRLPRWARDTMNTGDIAQDVLVRTVGHLDSFEPRHDGALQAYLRQAVLHRIRDEIRRTHREPGREDMNVNARSASPSPEQEAQAVELFEAYEAALSRLSEDDREAIALRVDLQLPYPNPLDPERLTGLGNLGYILMLQGDTARAGRGSRRPLARRRGSVARGHRHRHRKARLRLRRADRPRRRFGQSAAPDRPQCRSGRHECTGGRDPKEEWAGFTRACRRDSANV